MKKPNIKFNVRKATRFSSGIKKTLTKYQLLNRAGRLLRRKYFRLAANRPLLKTSSTKNILLDFRKRIKSKKLVKKSGTAAPSSNLIEPRIFDSFCERSGIPSSKIYKLPGRSEVNLYALSYASMYKTKLANVSLPTPAISVPQEVKRTAPTIPVPQEVSRTASAETIPLRKHSKNWIDPSVWKTMSGAERQAFLHKTGKHKNNVKYDK